jgi:hypothetical protein
MTVFTDANNNNRFAEVFLSQPYNVDQTEPPLRRKFISNVNQTSFILETTKNVIYASFFDLDENG